MDSAQRKFKEKASFPLFTTMVGPRLRIQTIQPLDRANDAGESSLDLLDNLRYHCIYGVAIKLRYQAISRVLPCIRRSQGLCSFGRLIAESSSWIVNRLSLIELSVSSSGECSVPNCLLVLSSEARRSSRQHYVGSLLL